MRMKIDQPSRNKGRHGPESRLLSVAVAVGTLAAADGIAVTGGGPASAAVSFPAHYASLAARPSGRTAALR